MHKRVALIVDNPIRDLQGLVLLARRLSQNGIVVHLVPHNLLFRYNARELWALMPDFVLLNYLRKNNEGLARRLADAGIPFGILDNEGGVLASFESYESSLALDSRVRDNAANYFCWGPKLADYLTKNRLFRQQQVLLTGAPRFDFYSSPWRQAAGILAEEQTELRERLVLINGNFPLANPLFQTPEEEVDMLVKRLGYNRDAILKAQRGERQKMRGMVALANHLASHFADVLFVYRPHPFERQETYEDMLEKLDNLRLIKTGTVSSWIVKAEAVIQKDCSTAIEAGFAGVPSLSPALSTRNALPHGG